MLFDMYILAWLHELRNQYNLATCWPQPANSKMAGAGGGETSRASSTSSGNFLGAWSSVNFGEISQPQEHWKQIPK